MKIIFIFQDNFLVSNFFFFCVSLSLLTQAVFNLLHALAKQRERARELN